MSKKKKFLIGYGISIFIFLVLPIAGILTGLFVTFIFYKQNLFG